MSVPDLPFLKPFDLPKIRWCADPMVCPSAFVLFSLPNLRIVCLEHTNHHSDFLAAWWQRQRVPVTPIDGLCLSPDASIPFSFDCSSVPEARARALHSCSYTTRCVEIPGCTVATITRSFAACEGNGVYATCVRCDLIAVALPGDGLNHLLCRFSKQPLGLSLIHI